MSTPETTNGSTSPSVGGSGQALLAESARPAGITEDIGEVLAQIPDLDPKSAPKAGIKRLDGRVISQALSMKLVFGLGIGLVIGAILPSLFGRGNRESKTVRELPAWNARESESNSATARTQAPLWTNPQTQATAAEPQVSQAAVSPQPPQADGYRPAALGRQMWSPPQGPAAAPTPPQATGNVTPDYARAGPTTPPVGVERSYGSTRERREWQADSRNDPAAPYRNATAYDYRGNPVEPPAARRDGQMPGGASDDRYSNFTDPNGGRAIQSAPSNPNGGAFYGNPRDNELGVAHFDGTISAPPPRTN